MQTMVEERGGMVFPMDERSVNAALTLLAVKMSI